MIQVDGGGSASASLPVVESGNAAAAATSSSPQPTAWAALMEAPDSFIPRTGSAAYTQKSYWDYRFATEPSYEWLSSYAAFAPVVRRLVATDARVLLVGCGNSELTTDLAADGYTQLTSSDYSAAVIERMRAKSAGAHPAIRWVVADMTDLSAVFDAGSFDAIIDKAAMDALLADGGDVWEAPAPLLRVAASVMDSFAHVLRPGGVLLQVSFAQPHFRRQYLAHDQLEYVGHTSVATGFGYFCYELNKK